MTAIQCSGHILAVVNEKNSTPILYDLSPTLSLIETLVLEESSYFQLFCDENALVIFPIQDDEYFRIDLTFITVVPQVTSNASLLPTVITLN